MKLCLQSGSFGGGIAQLRRPRAQQNTCKRKKETEKQKRDRAGKHGEETQRETFCRVKLQGNSARPKLRMSSLNELR